MIRATDLAGRAVVDVDAARKLGTVEKVILDPEARRVAGFVVSRNARLFAKGDSLSLPASAVVAVGPDALMIHADTSADLSQLESLPDVSEVVGRKVVTRSGRLLGTINDVLIDDEDGHIIGYTVAEPNGVPKLEQLISGERPDHQDRYIRADADLRASEELVIAPEDAITAGDDPGAAGTLVATTDTNRIPTARWAGSISPRTPS